MWGDYRTPGPTPARSGLPNGEREKAQLIEDLQDHETARYRDITTRALATGAPYPHATR